MEVTPKDLLWFQPLGIEEIGFAGRDLVDEMIQVFRDAAEYRLHPNLQSVDARQGPSFADGVAAAGKPCAFKPPPNQPIFRVINELKGPNKKTTYGRKFRERAPQRICRVSTSLSLRAHIRIVSRPPGRCSASSQ
jgi:hypothetical protein